MLNYRRDGSPFMNLIMVVPLQDQDGKLKYYLGAQLDITDMVQHCSGLTSLQKLVDRILEHPEHIGKSDLDTQIMGLSSIQQLCREFSAQEIEKVSNYQQQPISPINNSPMKPFPATRKPLISLRNSLQLSGQGSVPPLRFYQNVGLKLIIPTARLLIPIVSPRPALSLPSNYFRLS